MIDGLTYFAWAVMGIIVLISTAIFVFLGSLPKKIADKHNHPQAAAINAASWLGLILGGIGWPFALVWAYTRSGNVGYGNDANTSKPLLESSAERTPNVEPKKNPEALKSKAGSEKS